MTTDYLFGKAHNTVECLGTPMRLARNIRFGTHDSVLLTEGRALRREDDGMQRSCAIVEVARTTRQLISERQSPNHLA